MPVVDDDADDAREAYVSHADRAQAIAIGYDEHLAKPIDLRALTRFVTDTNASHDS